MKPSKNRRGVFRSNIMEDLHERRLKLSQLSENDQRMLGQRGDALIAQHGPLEGTREYGETLEEAGLDPVLIFSVQAKRVDSVLSQLAADDPLRATYKTAARGYHDKATELRNNRLYGEVSSIKKPIPVMASLRFRRSGDGSGGRGFPPKHSEKNVQILRLV